MKHLMSKYFLLLFLISQNFIIAQVGIGTITPNAALDISSTNSGILVPRVDLNSLTDTVTVVNPQGGAIATGTLVFNTGNGLLTNQGFYYWNSTQWVSFNNSNLEDKDWILENTSNTNPTNKNDNIYTDGNVAIGTQTPNYKLHISSRNGGTDPTIMIEADADDTDEEDNPRLILSQDGGDAQGYLLLEPNGSANRFFNNSEANSLVLGSNTGTSVPTKIHIAPYREVAATFDITGNVAIGPDDQTPDRLLHVVKDQDATTAIRIDNTNNSTNIFHTALEFYDGGTAKASISNNNNLNYMLVEQFDNGNIYFRSGGQWAMGLDNTGNTNIYRQLNANNITATQFNLSNLNPAPASATAPGTRGEIRVTTNYIYVCIAANTWVRSALSSW